jgi:hypothetical protein
MKNVIFRPKRSVSDLKFFNTVTNHIISSGHLTPPYILDKINVFSDRYLPRKLKSALHNSEHGNGLIRRHGQVHEKQLSENVRTLNYHSQTCRIVRFAGGKWKQQ